MMTKTRSFFVVLALSGALAGVLLACSSDDEDPVTPAGPDGSTSDASTAADSNTTPPSIEDAGADADAAKPRPPFDASAPEVKCAVTPCNTAIVAGPKNYCTTAADGVVRCWGEPSTLGVFIDAAAPEPGATPVAIGGLGKIVDVGIGSYDTCVASNDGGVFCFGQASAEPVLVPNIVGAATRLAIGDDRKCAVLGSGDLSCWGSSYATGTEEGVVDLDGEKVVDARMQWISAFALSTKGTLFSWGSERYSLGRVTAVSPDLTPSPVIGLPPIFQMAASDSHVCALSVDGRLFCWGRADSGALGLGYIRHEFFPVEVLFPGPAYPTKVVASQTHSCARMTDGTLTCWANLNFYGELGSAATAGVYAPTQVKSVTKPVADVAIGNGSTCAVLVDGSVQCWGDNSSGQLGQATRDSVRHPVPQTVKFQ